MRNVKRQTMTNTEYLLRTVRESECMDGWQDTFSKMREDISKKFLASAFETEQEAFEVSDAFEK